MHACLTCEKELPRPKEKGHREREYCSDVCRQRAYRQRSKEKQDVARSQRALEIARNEAETRRLNAQDHQFFGDVHKQLSYWGRRADQLREELYAKDDEIARLYRALGELEKTKELFYRGMVDCNAELAAKDVEIAHLKDLLDRRAKQP